jgi:hypothetical protein
LPFAVDEGKSEDLAKPNLLWKNDFEVVGWMKSELVVLGVTRPKLHVVVPTQEAKDTKKRLIQLS